MIKASGVSPEHGALVGQTDCYLASRGEGFAFKNKFVAAIDMDDFMSS